MNRHLQQSIAREENARYYICANEECDDFEQKWRVDEDDEPSTCETCGTEGRAWKGR